ncbi:MAG: hypothetical protein K9H50_01025 [Aurantimicrobium sp.]|jgi:hypothetical protein|nr:hypothetical protein [Aurantimicrobium sp.]
MSRTRTIPLLASFTAGLFLLAGCAANPSSPTSDAGRQASAGDAASSVECAGVWLQVDFDILGAPLIETCVDTVAPIEAMTVLDAAAVTITGTADYGLDVVCRVNGLPAADQSLKIPGHESYRETCATMTPEFGYWSVWVESRATGEWDYASVGIDDLTLAPGESLGFTFTSGTNTEPPAEPLTE